MNIKQFEYKPLSHYSYAIVSNGEMAIVDPERNPMQYYNYAEACNAKIVAVIETHPHADFVSSHLQIHQETGATIYNSKKLGGDYPHNSFDDGNSIKLGVVTLKAINTPGHSPDSITIVATQGNETVLFTGDTLFIGDVGRPDLREKAGNMQAKRKELAKAMYNTMQNKFNDLPNDVLIYPAHGAGSLCGKNMSSDSSSTLGNERMGNWAFQKQTEEAFIDTILEGQPMIPHYFGFAVDLNKKGAPNLRNSIGKISFKMNVTSLEGIVVDIRAEEKFKQNHIKGSYNIQAASDNSKFETWLGAIIEPEEKFHLIIETSEDLDKMLHRIAKIGYEQNLLSVSTIADSVSSENQKLDLEHFRKNTDDYTIVDVRNQSEIADGKIFENALAYPLNELRGTANNIPINKPIVVHCAAGYRSAAGSSILAQKLKNAKIYDLSDAITEFK